METARLIRDPEPIEIELGDGEYTPVERGALIELGAAGLAARLVWS